jgi:hypothetical protein
MAATSTSKAERIGFRSFQQPLCHSARSDQRASNGRVAHDRARTVHFRLTILHRSLGEDLVVRRIDLAIQNQVPVKWFAVVRRNSVNPESLYGRKGALRVDRINHTRNDINLSIGVGFRTCPWQGQKSLFSQGCVGIAVLRPRH